MSTVSIIGIDATWKSSCFPSTVADDADSTARNNRTGVLMVPEIGTGTGIVILDLGRRNPDVNASQIPNTTSTTSQVPEKPSIRARDCRLWERMQATGFPCLVAVMAQPLVEASHRTVKERSSDMEGSSDIGRGAGAVPTPVHHPLSMPTTLSPPPLTALPPSASDQTAKQLLLYMSIDAPPVVSPQDTTCTADHGDVANGVGDYSCSETPAPVAVPSLSHDTSSSYVRGKLCEPLNPGVARGTTATPPMSGLPCPIRSSTLLGTRSQTRALVPLYYGSAPVASLRYLLASTAVRVDAHSTPWASLTAVSTVMREAERTALVEQGDESQQQPTVSTSACTAASTGAVGVAQVVCRAVWPIPPWPANALPEFFPEAFPLLSYSMNTDGDYHDASMTEPSPKKMPGPLSAAAADDDDVEAAISDLVEHLGEWNSSLVASMLMSAQVIAVSTSTTQSPSPSLPRKQWETAETKHKTMKGKADTDAADVEKEAGRVTAASAFLTSMPELLALLFQYWHQQRQHQEASTSLHAFAAPTTAAAATASTTTGFAAHEGIGMIRQSPASPPQTPAHISRAFFQDPQGHAYPTEEDWLKSIEHTPEKTTSPSCLTAPPPPADRHNYTTASFVEQLLMSIEFSIAYLVNRKREAAEAAATGRQARVDALSEVVGGNSVHAPPLTSSQVQQRLQCYRLPCISSRTPFEVVWGLYLAQRMRMLCDPATLAAAVTKVQGGTTTPVATQRQSSTPPQPLQQHTESDLADPGEVEHPQDACGLCCTAMDVWTLWEQTAKPTTTPPPLATPTALTPTVEIGGITNTHPPLAGRTPLQPSQQSRTRMLPPRNVESRDAPPDRMPALPPPRSSTSQPPPSRLPSHISFTVQTASNPCKNSHSAPDVGAIGGSTPAMASLRGTTATAVYERRLTSPPTPFPARCTQLQREREPAPISSTATPTTAVAAAAAATADLLQVLPSLLPIRGSITDTCSSPSPQPPTTLLRNTPPSLQRPPKQLCAFTAATPELWASMRRAQKHDPVDAGQQERRERRAFTEARTTAGPAPAQQQQQATICTTQRSRIESLESFGGGSGDSADDAEGSRDDCKTRAAAQGSGSAYDSLRLATVLPQTHAQQRRGVQRVLGSTVKPLRRVVSATPAAERCRWETDFSGEVGSGSDSAARRTPNATGAAPSEKCRRAAQLPNVAQWMEQHDGVDATLVTQSLSRHRRPRGGLYSAASFVAVLSAAVARLLSHDFPATPSSLDPSTPASASCATASVAAQRLELIRCGRFLPTLATLESLNLLKRCVPVWCYTFDPITGCRTPSEHGDNIGGSSGHAHNQSYLQRYAPSLNRAVPGSRGGNSGGSGAGSGIHELGRASKAGLTATYRYMADTAKTVLDAVKSSAPNKAHDVMMGIDGDNTQPAGGGDARCPVFPGTPATTIPPPPKATPVVSPPIVVPPVHGSGNVTRDVTKDPSLYYAVCGLYITEQDIIIRAMPTVEVRRQRERAKLKRRQHQQQLHKGLSTAHTRFWSWAKSSGGGENYLGHSGTPLGDGEAERFRCADGNTSGGEGEGEGVDDDDDSDDEEVVELLVLPRVSLVSVTACAVDRSAGGVFSHKHAHKLHDHLEKQPNITPLYSPITPSSVPHMSSATAHLARRGVSFRGGNGSGGGDGHGEGDRGGGGARRSNATTTSSPAAHTRHKLPRTSAIPREPGQTPFATMSTVVVLRLESVDMQTVWLEFTDEAVLNEVYQMLCATLASTTQPSGIADGPSRLSYTPLQQPLPCHGNRFLSSARRPWSMVPLVLLAAKVLPQGGATSPFIQAFLKNVTVAAVMLNAQGTVPSPATVAVRSPSLPSTQSSIISLPSSPPPHGLPTTLADTWWLYDPAREFARQGLPEEHWTLTRVNTDYAFCPTYPSAFVVPASVAHAMESGAMDGQHRMSRRVEAVAFYYAPTGGVLVRSAQPTLATLMTDVPTGPALEWTSRMTGGRLGKAAQDIPSLPPPTTTTTQPQPQPTTTTVPLRDVHCFTLNAFAAAAGVIAQQIFVMDLRSPRAAVGNAGKGGGTMDFLSYPFRGVEYAGLPNIHTVKKAWRRLRASLTHDAPLQLRGDDSGCLETQYVQHAGEPPYAAVVAAAELSLRAKRPASGIGVTRPQLASLLPRLHKRESRTLRHVRGGTSGAEGEALIGYSDSEHVDGDDENENAGAGDDGAREGATSGTGAATSAPSRLPFSLGSVRWSAFFSAMTPAGGASVTAMMPAAQREWLAYLAMLLNTAVVAARRVCGVPTDPLYVPAMQHNGPSANCFSYIVGHAFSHFRLPKSSSSAALPQPPPPGSRRGLRTPATAGASAARSFKPPLASYEHDAHKTLAHVVFLNCSDGWDRTPQISVLVQLLLDPYYRTVEGLCILLERELLCFGHPTQLRSAAVRGNAANHTVQPVQDDRSVDVAVAASAAAAAANGIGTQVPMEARQSKDTVTAARSSPTHAAHASAESQSGATVESDRRSDSEVSQVSCDVAPQAATASVTGDDDHYGYDDGDASSVILLEEVEAEGFNAAAESKPKEKALYRWPQRARAALSRGGSTSASAGDAGATWDREQRCSTPPAGAHAPSVSASMPAKPPAASPPPSSQSSNEAAPILAQLLDAIHQLVVLYPACFEYTPQFVCLLLDLLHSGMISTFSVNCEQHVGSQWVAEGTLSLSQWCALLLSTTTATPSTVSAPKPVMANPPRLSSPTVARSGGGGATTALIPITAHNPRATVAPELLRQRDPRSALALPLSPPSLPSSYADPVSELGGAEANVGAASSADTSFHRLDSTFLMCDAGMEEAEEEEEEEEDGGKKDHDQKDSVEKTVDLSRCSSGEEGRGKAFALHRRRSGNVGASGKQPRRTVAVARLQASGCTLAAPPLGHGETVGKEEPAAMEGRSLTPPLPTLAPPDPCLGLYDFDYTTRWGVSLTSEAPPQPRSGHAPLTSFSGCSAATSPSTHSAQPHGEASRSGGSRQREHSQQPGGYNSNAAMVVDEFTRRLLPISYSALYYSNYLNPEFSLRHNRVDVGPLVDFILPYKLTLWRAAYARHSFWGARQAQLQHSTGQYHQQYHQQQQQQQQRPPQNSWRGSGGGIGHGVPNATGDLRDYVGRYGGGGNGCSADIATQALPARPAFEAARWQPRSNSSGPSSSLADTSVTSRAAGGSGGTSVLPGEDKSECHVYGRPTPFADTSALCATPTPGIYQFHIGSSSEDEEEDHAGGGGEEEEEGEAGMLNGCGHTCQGART
ncbi:hypothetical protein JKF63_07477 [Porcisia hertigi]|uniref:Myotubularin phosphatase domain-containing protein n=1 Tax=Porcisia hertigi TaxID=2761500 RepID=A0A836I1U9_9TRYP|nr:hypothetical protein JKF63_07477 [Porcisia hertigi]